MVVTVLAQAILPVLSRGGECTPCICIGWFQSAQVQNVREKTKGVGAFYALDIFKKDKISAVVAVKGFHSANIALRMRWFEKYRRRALP